MIEERTIEGSSGNQNELGKLNRSENQRKHGQQNHQMTFIFVNSEEAEAKHSKIECPWCLDSANNF